MKVALCGTPSTEEGWEQVWEVIGQLRERKISVYGSPDLAWAFARRQRDAVSPFSVGTLHRMPARHLPLASDLLVVWGGTDILLRHLCPIARHGPTVLLVGDSEVFPAVPESALREGVERVLRGEAVLDSRMLLGAGLSGSGWDVDQKERSGQPAHPEGSKESPKNEVSFVGAGEVVFQRGAEDTLLRIELTADGRFLTRYEADGLIITSPTGSVARSLSVGGAAGGPFVVPGTEGFLVTPVASHTLTARPVLMPETAKLEVNVQNRRGSAYLRVDRATCTLGEETRVTVQQKAQDLRLADPEGKTPGGKARNGGEASDEDSLGEGGADRGSQGSIGELSPVSVGGLLQGTFSFPRQQTARSAFFVADSPSISGRHPGNS